MLSPSEPVGTPQQSSLGLWGCLGCLEPDLSDDESQCTDQGDVKIAAYTYPATGERYEGEWDPVSQERHGWGAYFYQNGDVYAGEWGRNIKMGWGVYLHHDVKEKYEGEWRYNMRHGLGCITATNSSVTVMSGHKDVGSHRFVGEFKDDVRHGPGICILRNGKLYAEVWREGKLEMSSPLFGLMHADTYGDEIAVPITGKDSHLDACSSPIVVNPEFDFSPPFSAEPSGASPASDLRRVQHISGGGSPRDESHRSRILLQKEGKSPHEAKQDLLKSLVKELPYSAPRNPHLGKWGAETGAQGFEDSFPEGSYSPHGLPSGVSLKETTNGNLVVVQNGRGVGSVSSVSLDDFTSFDATARSHVSYLGRWTVEEVGWLLKSVGLTSLQGPFKEHQVDGYVLSTLVSMVEKEEEKEDSFLLAGLQLSGDYSARKILCALIRTFLKVKRKCEGTHMTQDEVRQSFSYLLVESKELDFQREIGKGGYGQVFEAKQAHKSVAVKVFDQQKPRKRVNLTLSRDFVSELTALSRLRHPNITLLLGVCIEPHVTCLITEYVTGGSLFDLLHRFNTRTTKVSLTKYSDLSDGDAIVSPMPSERFSGSLLLRITRDMAFGLSYLHAHSVLHCDLKSSNILLTDNLRAKICDFGLSSCAADTDRLALGLVGTHHWMAPEVLRGEEYTSSADVYSFAMICWETAHRRIPFRDLTSAQVIGLVGYSNHSVEFDLDLDNCPLPLLRLLKKILSSKPAERPDFHVVSRELKRLHSLSVAEVEQNLGDFHGLKPKGKDVQEQSPARSSFRGEATSRASLGGGKKRGKRARQLSKMGSMPLPVL